MQELKPILSNVELRRAKGKFEVQLEIPESSTLSSQDIDKVLALASWQVDPNMVVKDYEGGRAVIIKREISRKLKQLELKALEISGIGYKEMPAVGGNRVSSIRLDAPFYPPSRANFKETPVGKRMRSSYAANGVLQVKMHSYCPTGSYTEAELDKKVKNTLAATQLPLERMVVSPIEVYGRYLDDELRDVEGKPFGFMVVPVPDIDKERIAGELFRAYGTFLSTAAGHNWKFHECLPALETIARVTTWNFIRSLNELHNKGRGFHLQTHLSNVYDVDGIPYVMDWSTFRPLNGSVNENLINRVIDMKRPADDVLFMFSDGRQALQPELGAILYPLAMDAYIGANDTDFLEVAQNAERVLGYVPSDVGVIANWMVQRNLERRGAGNLDFKKIMKYLGNVDKD